MIKRFILLGLSTVFLATACVLVKQATPTQVLSTQELEATSVVVAECPPAAVPTVTSCPTQSPGQAQPASARNAHISSGNLTLRAGPSIAHPALASFPMGAEVKILGKAPGGSWVAVSVPGGQLGWMYTQYLGVELSDQLGDVPDIDAAQSWVIEGQVVDDTGQPVEYVPVSVALGGPVNYPDFTDAGGRFAVFVPLSQSGPWTVAIQGVGCLTRLVDVDCQLVNHVLRNSSQGYQQGQAEPLKFVYEVAALRLQGKVVDGTGNPYGGAGVFATRSDGAYVTGKADSEGLFEIPITVGTWDLKATRGVTLPIEIPESGYAGDLTLVGSPN